MKKFILINCLLIVCGVAGAQETSIKETPEEMPVDATEKITDETMKDERGYFFGYSFGNVLKDGGNIDVNLDRLLKGVEDSIAGKQPDLTSVQQQGVIAIVRTRQQEMVATKEADANRAVVDNLEKSEIFMAENKAKRNIKTTSSGLQYEHLSKGKGARPHVGDTVVVHYEGKLASSGHVFDSSIERGKPAEFGLGQVIQGWTEGLQLMKLGGKTRFFIPPDLAYGPGGTRGVPPNSVLIFEVELIEIK